MKDLIAILEARFGDAPAAPPEPIAAALPALVRLADRRVKRRFKKEPVSLELLQTLSALALSAPTKSDLQQRDIVIVRDPALRGELNALLAEQDWIPEAPELIVFCGNNRRQRLVHTLRAKPFVNDHLDAFFNAAVDGAIALATFVQAAETVGLGCCPISIIRNRAEDVSRLLGLPDHVFPIAGLGLGWPAYAGALSLRLPLSHTVHVDRFNEADIAGAIEAYDRRRAERQPYRSQRQPEVHGQADPYTWSEDKARQYTRPERADFGAFVRRKGFNLS